MLPCKIAVMSRPYGRYAESETLCRLALDLVRGLGYVPAFAANHNGSPG